jgi:hypothetical protein
VLSVLFSLVLVLQLQALGTIELPQIITPEFSEEAIPSGRTAAVGVTLEVREGFLINRIPQMQPKLKEVAGLDIAELELVSPAEDPKSTDSYYVDVPGFEVRVLARQAGSWEIPGELVYFFCNTADGYCARQTVEVSIPVRAE